VPTERLAVISSAQREYLDPMLITSGRHLRQVLSHYVEHYNVHRPHRARNLRPPDSDGTLTATVTDPTAARTTTAESPRGI
jgi:putative transposase